MDSKINTYDNTSPSDASPTEKSGCGSKCGKKSQCCSNTHKLEVFDWLADLPESQETSQMIEVQFKNTRKGYFLNSNNIEVYKGDIVAVEATPGHDIGEVTLTGKLVLLQMKKNNYRALQGEHKRVYRIAKQTDIDKHEEAKALEHKTMLRARELAEELKLNMKISDVEYQGDGNKAIFYYIADERVDFRTLIKVYAENFRVKIEMKQIGARQEAGRVGGIGPCGRELCCSSSISNFVSVSTSAARFQDISLNPQKLAGQCGKLKCCLNYEADTYVEALRKLPSRDTILDTKDNAYFHFKTDILAQKITYSTSKTFPANTVTIDKDRAFEIIRMNRKGQKPLKLDDRELVEEEKNSSKDILDGNINRFDSTKKKNAPRKKPLPNKKDGKGEVRNEDRREARNENRNEKPQIAEQQGENRRKITRNSNPRPETPKPIKSGEQNTGGEENRKRNNNNNNNNRRRNNAPRNNNNRKNESGEAGPSEA